MIIGEVVVDGEYLAVVEIVPPAVDDEVAQPADNDEVVPSLDHQLKSWKWMKKVGLHFYHEHQ